MSSRDFKNFLLTHVNCAMFSELTKKHIVLLSHISYDYYDFMRFMDNNVATISGVSFNKTTTYDKRGYPQISSLSISITLSAKSHLIDLLEN
jgi:hypothetical protein